MTVAAQRASPPRQDWRDIANGVALPTPGMKYVDQPYVVKLKDGAWLCLVTLGASAEGQPGNHTAALVSRDMGKTWSAPVKVCGPYAVPLVVGSGRIYALTPQSQCFSDDGGRTWSKLLKPNYDPDVHKRVSKSAQGGYEGSLGWSVSLPLVTPDGAYVAFARVGLGRSPRRTDVYFMRSANVLSEADATKVEWQLLPGGEEGIRGPAWDKPEHRSEEPHLVRLSNGTLYVVFRTDQGHIGHSTSEDGGKTWAKAQALKFPDGRTIKHSLACSSLWKCSNGKYLLWFHNHSGPREFSAKMGWPYADRNPAWICGGVEKDGTIAWSQPEVLLYAQDLSYEKGRLSYPGFMEDGGRYFIFETQKKEARMHEIPAAIFEGAWKQAEGKTVAVAEGFAFEHKGAAASKPQFDPLPVPAPPAVSGLTIEMAFTLSDASADQVLLDSRSRDEGAGCFVTTTRTDALRLTITDGKRRRRVLETDAGVIRSNQPHHVVFILDGAADVMWALLDGRVCDGGAQRQFGWARLDTDYPGSDPRPPRRQGAVEGVTLGPGMRIAPALKGAVSLLRLYGRALTTSEAIANHRALR